MTALVPWLLPRTLLFGALITTPLLTLQPLQAAGGDPAKPRQPAPPASKVEYYEPDQQACVAKSIESAFHQHLLPWQDQPAEVLERLKQLQAGMTRNTLRRCVSKGLLTPDQASGVERNLGLAGAKPPAVGQSDSSGTRP